MKRPILDYYGGKFILRKWVMDYFPDHSIYVEPFGGGASVLLSKDPVKVEVYNDIDDEIVNFFDVAKNRGKELHNHLVHTPYSRSIYLRAREVVSDPLEMAVNTVVKSFFGIGDSIHNSSGFRNSKTSNASPSKTFKNYVDYFPHFIERLRPVVIENLSYGDVIAKYDSEKTLFYADPPYVFSSRSKKHSYGHELSDNDHIELLEKLSQVKGSVVLSGYENDIYKRLDWPKYKKETRTQKNKRTECLWVKL